jgi:hypothetical protein
VKPVTVSVIFQPQLHTHMKLQSFFARAAALLALTLGTAGAFAASNYGQTPPASVIVSAGGYEWVYASPCAGQGTGCDGMVSLQDGFHYASAAEWNASFTSISALVSAFTGNAGTICASAWFSPNYNHCDIGDAASGYIWHSPLAPDAYHADNYYAETFLVRNAAAVPEPATVGMMIAGLGLLGLRRRRQA